MIPQRASRARKPHAHPPSRRSSTFSMVSSDRELQLHSKPTRVVTGGVTTTYGGNRAGYPHQGGYQGLRAGNQAGNQAGNHELISQFARLSEIIVITIPYMHQYCTLMPKATVHNLCVAQVVPHIAHCTRYCTLSRGFVCHTPRHRTLHATQHCMSHCSRHRQGGRVSLAPSRALSPLAALLSLWLVASRTLVNTHALQIVAPRALLFCLARTCM
jgi:hypothetical protein